MQISDKHTAEQGAFFATEVIPQLKGCGSKITLSVKNLHRTIKFTEEALNLLSHRTMTYLTTASIPTFLESSSVDYHDGVTRFSNIPGRAAGSRFVFTTFMNLS